MKVSEVKYKTKPFDCWEKNKELIREQYQDIATAKEKGKLLVLGCAGTPYYLLAGFGDYAFFAGEPYGATLGANPEFSLQCLHEWEMRGYSRETCAYYRNVCGSMFLDKYFFTGGPFPKFDFIWSDRHCPSGHPKAHQVIAEYQGIPIYAIDDELHHQQSGKMEQRLEYWAGQLLDGIEWIEKVTGRKFDEEKAIEEVKNSFKCEVIWGEINLLNNAIPAPMDFKSLMAFVPLPSIAKGRRSTNEFLETLLDELKDRISEGIAAVPNEKYRLVFYGPPPYSTLRMFRVFEKEGVNFVACLWYAQGLWAKMVYHEDGSIVPTKTPEELGWPPMKSREDIIRTMVRWRMEFPSASHYDDVLEKSTLKAVDFVRHFKADGMVLTSQLGCVPSNLGVYDFKLAFQKAGIPVMMLAYSIADSRDNDDAKIIRQMDAFFETIKASKG